MQFDELAPEMAKAVNACKELLRSQRFKKVFHYALSIGNYVNGGTAKGGKHGILMKSLDKMGDSRGRDKKTTLLDFLVETLMGLKGPNANLIKFFEDLEHAANAGETSIKGLAAEVEILARDLLKIDRQAKKLQEGIKGGATPRENKFFSQIDLFVSK